MEFSNLPNMQPFRYHDEIYKLSGNLIFFFFEKFEDDRWTKEHNLNISDIKNMVENGVGLVLDYTKFMDTDDLSSINLFRVLFGITNKIQIESLDDSTYIKRYNSSSLYFVRGPVSIEINPTTA